MVAEAWKAVLDGHQDARNEHRMKQLSFTSIKAVQMFGLESSAVRYLVEQLFGAEQTRNYIFKHHNYERDLLYEVSELLIICLPSKCTSMLVAMCRVLW